MGLGSDDDSLPWRSSQAQEGGALWTVLVCVCLGGRSGRTVRERGRAGRCWVGRASSGWGVWCLDKRDRDTGLCGNTRQEGGEQSQAGLIPGTSSQLAC